MADRSTLGGRLAECRERREWTQKRLADEAAISITFLSEMENDKRSPGATTLLRIADALGVSMDYLMRGESAGAPPRQPLVIPSDLADAADRWGWSVGETRDLLRWLSMVVARRGQGPDDGPVDRAPSTAEWKRLYMRYFGHDADR